MNKKNEEKGHYIITAYYQPYYCEIPNGTEEDAVEIAKIYLTSNKKCNPRIFKIEREICWREAK